MDESGTKIAIGCPFTNSDPIENMGVCLNKILKTWLPASSFNIV